jgi:GMP synthase-like glutamine amidotransferase
MPFRLGFLLCDQPLDHLAARYGDYPAMFARAFAAVSDAIEWRVYAVTAGELPTDADDCDGWLISGSRHGAYDALPWIAPLEHTIRTIAASTRPLVGMCFGHQLIGQALGGKVSKAAQGWGLGLHCYQVLRSEAWMTPAKHAIVVPACHQDQVVELPRGAARLVRNDHCENFVVRYPGRVLGVQGHPEFEPDFMRELVDWRRASLPPPLYADALASLATAHDSLLVKRWIGNFLGIPLLDTPTESA